MPVTWSFNRKNHPIKLAPNALLFCLAFWPKPNFKPNKTHRWTGTQLLLNWCKISPPPLLWLFRVKTHYRLNLLSVFAFGMEIIISSSILHGVLVTHRDNYFICLQDCVIPGGSVSGWMDGWLDSWNRSKLCVRGRQRNNIDWGDQFNGSLFKLKLFQI